MIDIRLGLASMDKGQTPDHLIWRDAVENLVRKTETVVNLSRREFGRTHHRDFAQRVKQIVSPAAHLPTPRKLGSAGTPMA